MKHLLTLCMFICSIQGLKAQHCSHAETKTALRTQIESREDTTQSGTLKYYLKLKALDTLTVDSIRLKSAYFTSFSYNGNYPIVLNMNDSILIEITVNYNNNSLPYYYKSIDHYIFSHSNDIEESMHLSASNIYFTPYGTTEVWNMIDFYSLPRVWEIQKTPEPQRVYISKDSLPVSDIEQLDSTHEAWQENFSLWSVCSIAPCGCDRPATYFQ